MIIGFIGYGGAGKSEAAKHLRQRHGFVSPHIGHPLKQMLRALLSEFGYNPYMIDRYLEGDLKREIIPELQVTSTQAQQHIGVELGRTLWHDRVWIDAWCRRVDEHLAAGRSVANESVRFANEAEEIRARGGVIIEIRRPGVGPLPGGHVSEVLPCQPDTLLHNDGPVEILRTRIDGLVARYS